MSDLITYNRSQVFSDMGAAILAQAVSEGGEMQSASKLASKSTTACDNMTSKAMQAASIQNAMEVLQPIIICLSVVSAGVCLGTYLSSVASLAGTAASFMKSALLVSGAGFGLTQGIFQCQTSLLQASVEQEKGEMDATSMAAQRMGDGISQNVDAQQALAQALNARINSDARSSTPN
ncbi:MAG: hypothetical protein A2Y28_04745 [Chlamydiae bacterium GWC2_50_10]|nr:MAG: hypothetical protein A2Z85_03415 [Chlamydiae bacterium GWA2_50_15]OGN54941.1 MAG: hypothetical protein A2Y28_04745 [Chlamydiae bacterium GWC2_50_10]OGN58292.1 MAG: hypothetical protein A3D18_02335 [Chlamydiae bacterium RIFCSPHIGHO2_02_FULL_49_29]OGN63207.1 MAG: hypothetical protein A3E26_03740 [Chlamydiae bacterium RIFCSPHIGHO2_12_FULL_49_32]OGN68542.1 MAG: hypothetical protein A3I15_06200 [Chlamydiae bacterium RIFCSPLOWO2_02_FULL_49_12]OGN74980.1 MAG: hypothetical protein A3G30_05205 